MCGLANRNFGVVLAIEAVETVFYATLRNHGVWLACGEIIWYVLAIFCPSCTKVIGVFIWKARNFHAFSYRNKFV
jgi:hypothetical protein